MSESTLNAEIRDLWEEVGHLKKRVQANDEIIDRMNNRFFELPATRHSVGDNIEVFSLGLDDH